MITLGLVDSVDADGVYVTAPGARGLVRGPYQTLQNVTAGDRVLMVTTDDGEDVIVGQAAAIRPRSTPATSTDNAVARFDGTGGALQNSGVTIADSGGVTVSGGYVSLEPSSGSPALNLVASASATYSEVNFTTAGSSRWRIRKNATAESGSNAGSNLEIQRRNDSGATLSTITINRATGKITFPDVGATGGLEYGSGGPRDMSGSGTPEGVVSAPVGSTWRRTNGGAGTSFYIKESGTGNTGWVAK